MGTPSQNLKQKGKTKFLTGQSTLAGNTIRDDTSELVRLKENKIN